MLEPARFGTWLSFPRYLWRHGDRCLALSSRKLLNRLFYKRRTIYLLFVIRCYQTTTHAESSPPLVEENTAVVGVLVAISIVLTLILVKINFWLKFRTLLHYYIKCRLLAVAVPTTSGSGVHGSWRSSFLHGKDSAKQGQEDGMAMLRLVRIPTKMSRWMSWIQICRDRIAQRMLIFFSDVLMVLLLLLYCY